MAEVIDIIATRILLESQQATKALADFDAATGKATSRVAQLAQVMQKLKAETGRGVQDLVKTMQALNAPKAGGQFGQLGLNNKQIADAGKLVTLFEQQAAAKNKVAMAAEKAAAAESKQKAVASLPQNIIPQFVQKNFGNINDYIAQSSNKIDAWKRVVVGSANAAGVSFEQAGSQLKKMVSGTTVAPLNTALKQLGDDGRGAFQRLIDGAHFARIAVGALVSMLLFQGIQAVTSFFQTAIKEARDFEATLYRISNVERILSLEGIEVSVQGIKKGIKDIQDALPIFAQEDIAQLVGSVATTTKELGYTEEQILQLSAAYAILNVNSAATETVMQTASRGVNSLISPQAKSIGDLGLAFGAAKIEAKAFEMQILSAGESFSDLTEKEKQQIKFQITLEAAGIDGIAVEDLREQIQEAGGDFEALGAYLESNDAKLYENAAAWSDLKVAVGQVFLPLIPSLTGFLEGLWAAVQIGKVLIIEYATAWGALGVAIKGVLTGNIKSVEELRNVFLGSADSLRTTLTNQFFPEVPDNAPDWFMEGWGNRIQADADTATAAVEELGSVEEEDTSKMLEDIDQKIQDIIVDAKQAQEDLDVKLGQKEDDLDLEYIRKEEDAARDHARKLDDINQDAIRKAEDAKRKAREDEKKAERDLLQKLKELRDKFLMDLEDALHERDARQVLRLIREYQMDKKHLLERKKLDDQERKDKLAEDLAAIEIERQRKIADEQIDYQRKLADLAAQKQREQEELALWYAREQEDIQRNIQQRLEKLLAGYIAEGQITEEQQAAITAILAKHFGNNMALVDQMVAYMQQRFAEMAAFSLQAPVIYPNQQGTRGAANVGSGRRFAEGGTYLADRPTTVTFGEAGLEAATFTPIGREGRDVNKMFGDLGGSMGGNLQLGIMLSPELRAEIINTTLDKVSVVVDHVRRER